MALSQRGTVLSARLAPMFRDVTALVCPRSVAVVGASSRRVSQGNLVIANLKEWGFPGPVIPVHPNATSIDDLPAVSSPEALPEGTDLAVVAIPAAGVGEALDRLERAGVRASVVFANGFTREDEDALRRFTRTSRIVVQGPNCMGLINFTDQLRLYPTRPSERVIPGNVALVAQSGSAAISIMNTTAVGFSKVITVGSEFQVTAADYVSWLASDAATSVIGVVTERIAHPVAFAEAAESAHAAGKAVIVLNVGTSSTGTAAAAAHTGALIGERDAYDCYFDACDIATVRDYDELIASLECRSLGVRSLRPGAQLAVVGISGGQTALACDIAEQASVPLAGLDEATKSALQRFLPGSTGENPIDIGATVIEEERRIREAVDAVLADPNVDGLALIQDAQSTLNSRSLSSYEPILASYSEAGRNAKKPVVMISPTSEVLHETVLQRLKSHGVPVVRGLREGFVAIGSLSKSTPGRAGSWAKAHDTEGAVLHPDVKALRAEIEQGPGRLSPETVNRLLDLYNIPRVRSILVEGEVEASSRCGELGFPLVVKLVSSDVSHRSDVGGVVLGVEDEKALAAAIAAITSRVTSRLPYARIDAFELQEEIRGAIEAMAGFTRSAPFGPLVAVGTGGTMVELDSDRTLGLAPLSVDDAKQMIRNTRLGRLLGGYRNLIPNTDLEPLARLVSDFSNLAADLGDTITACDLNPVMVQKESGAVRVVDALMIR
ncbi:MAG TPA: acetate--CoA ligase family protein [Vicinamibacteria bacterium]|nr:acetate--CoA ligase family protein [Vicinamibacteria bacterium]